MSESDKNKLEHKRAVEAAYHRACEHAESLRDLAIKTAEFMRAAMDVSAQAVHKMSHKHLAPGWEVLAATSLDDCCLAFSIPAVARDMIRDDAERACKHACDKAKEAYDATLENVSTEFSKVIAAIDAEVCDE